MDYPHFGSGIEGISVTGKPTNNVNKLMTSYAQEYTLTLKERGKKEEQIKGNEIGLEYSSGWGFGDSKDRQYPNVLSRIFIYNDDLRIGASFDRELLYERLDKLSCFDKNSIVEPENPSFIYTENGYVIEDEIYGNKVDKDILYKKVVNAILNKQVELDLEEAGCYVRPQYSSKSQKILEARDTLNKYISSSITYTFGGSSEIIDGSITNKWLKVDGNYDVTFNMEAIKSYLDALFRKYSVTGKARAFVASSGKTINLSGGDYALSINTDKEAKDLTSAIMSGEAIAKEPAYVPSEYVEIDLTKQHLWFYKNGCLVTEGDIVSGCLSWGMPTPEGVYRLNSKKRDAILRGPGYAAPVEFWMPFNGGIGMHDATWRHAFGGEIYKRDGSHGCINCPYSLAETIFNNIDVGTFVICYY